MSLYEQGVKHSHPTPHVVYSVWEKRIVAFSIFSVRVTMNNANSDIVTTNVHSFLCSNSPYYVLQQLDLVGTSSNVMEFRLLG